MLNESVKESKKDIPPRRLGFAHFIDSLSYTGAGFKRLLRESAAKQEIFGAIVVIFLFSIYNVRIHNWLIFILLFCLIIAIEAINTAIETLADFVSPEWSEAARNAKDLGSLAVAIILALTFIFVGLVLSENI